MIKAILFDFNDTLISSPSWMMLETQSLPRDAFSLLVSQGHIDPLTPDQFVKAELVFQMARQTANRTNQETSHVSDLMAMIDALGYHDRVNESLAESIVAELHRSCVQTVELMDGAKEALKDLKSLGLRLGIISNAAYAPFLTWTLRHFAILHFFEEIVVSADVCIRKPALEIFSLTLARMGLEPQHTAYVGDDYDKDVESAMQLGMRSVWYRPENGLPALDEATRVDAVVTGYHEMPVLAAHWKSNI